MTFIRLIFPLTVLTMVVRGGFLKERYQSVEAAIARNEKYLLTPDKKGNVRLHRRIAKKKYEEAEALINVRMGVRKINKMNESPLHLAAADDGAAYLIPLLLANGAVGNLNATNKKFKTPLFIAVEAGALKAAEALLVGKTAEDPAATAATAAIVKRAVLDTDAEEEFVDAKSEIDSDDATDEDEERATYAKFNLMTKANVKAKNVYGDTALHLACRLNEPAIVDLLLKYGAEINELNRRRLSPVQVAVQANAKEALRVLLEWKADVDAGSDEGYSALIWSVIEGFEHLTQMLVDGGANTELIGGSEGRCEYPGRTALAVAVHTLSVTVVEILLKGGADPNNDAISMTERKPLHVLVVPYYVRMDREEIEERKRKIIQIADLLLEYGADPLSRDCNGWTLLHYIVEMIDEEAFEIFTDKIRDEISRGLTRGPWTGMLDVPDKSGRNPLPWALHAGYDNDMIVTLIRLHCDREKDFKLGPADAKNALIALVPRFEYYAEKAAKRNVDTFEEFWKYVGRKSLKGSKSVEAYEKRNVFPIYLAAKGYYSRYKILTLYKMALCDDDDEITIAREVEKFEKENINELKAEMEEMLMEGATGKRTSLEEDSFLHALIAIQTGEKIQR